jgi:hypothetical protein
LMKFDICSIPCRRGNLTWFCIGQIHPLHIKLIFVIKLRIINSENAFYQSEYITLSSRSAKHYSHIWSSSFICCSVWIGSIVSYAELRIDTESVRTDCWGRYYLKRLKGELRKLHKNELLHFYCSPTAVVRRALGSTPPPVKWVPGDLFPGIKRPGREADHSPLTSAKVTKMWIYTSTTPYVFIALCSVNHRKNFTFYFLLFTFYFLPTAVCSVIQKSGSYKLATWDFEWLLKQWFYYHNFVTGIIMLLKSCLFSHR